MRGLDTPVSQIRHKVFVEVAKVAFDSDAENVKDDIEAIPYNVCLGDMPSYRESIHVERAIASERVRLAMGMSLRPEDRPVHITDGIKESNISAKYYEPPLMQVIPSACQACEHNKFEVSNMCKGCVAHPCMQVCPKKCITDIKGRAYIDQTACIKCGRCKAACPYDAISKKMRPCALACGVDAIGNDIYGRAEISKDKCVSCGMCMVACPFGAIADKSQIFQLIRCFKEEENSVIAEIAPAFVGQFGPKCTPRVMREALMQLGFDEVYEVALGADIGAVSEAKHYATKVVTGELPVLLTSCCPSWSMLAKNQFPDLERSVSMELTPMVATARSIKKKHPKSKVVFIGPCAAKKLEAMRNSVRSDVDFVITFEELNAIFEARNIDINNMEGTSSLHDATGAGRGYAIAGGVAGAIQKCVEIYYPEVEFKSHHVEGLAECKKVLQLAKSGKLDGYLIEGMGCPGGCVAGAGTLLAIDKAKANVNKMVRESTRAVPPKELEEIELD